uniref:WAP domain-containing protein n=1 Tax=Gopherus evgoodei TaxID=1825980 RepID=A0A8C4W5Y1_9SAUR
MAGASHWSSACCLALQGGGYTVHLFLAEKSGICPVVSVRCKTLSLPHCCQSDSQCAGAEKCCDTSCGLGCVLTQQGNYLIARTKPGTCPLIASTCRMINPPDKCKEDRDCFGPKKCCISVCGKECLPVKAGFEGGEEPPSSTH